MSANNLLTFIITGLFFLFFLNSCNQQSRGFALPEGDPEKGKALFSEFQCNSCHNIGDIEWTGEEGDVQLPLGGKVERMKTYGELVTSVINPSHKVPGNYKKDTVADESVSKMKPYNDVMTVQQLVDIVTFLQSEYKIETPPQYYYPY